MSWGKLAAAALALGAATPANAGVYSNDLGKCMVAKSSDEDKAVLVRWIFIAISSTPAIKDLANVNEPQRTENAKAVGALIGRLLTVDCRNEAVLGLKYEGAAALQASFAIVGQAAMATLMSSPSVIAGLDAPQKYIDMKALNVLFQEAGLQPPPSAI